MKGKDVRGSLGQTLGACRREREGAGRNKWVRREMGKKRKKGISRVRAILSKKVTVREGGNDSRRRRDERPGLPGDA